MATRNLFIPEGSEIHCVAIDNFAPSLAVNGSPVSLTVDVAASADSAVNTVEVSYAGGVFTAMTAGTAPQYTDNTHTPGAAGPLLVKVKATLTTGETDEQWHTIIVS